MARIDNIDIFKDTMSLCEKNTRLKGSVRKAIDSQKLIPESDVLPEQKKDRYADAARVVVSGKRSFEAAAGYKGQHVAVHNFASATNPGGGVEKGSTAQEECLCRCSGLFLCLSTPDMMNGFYRPHRYAHDPIHNDDIIYTPGVTVFKTDADSPRLMAESDWYDVDVITCAAPNLRECPSNSFNSGDGRAQAVISDEELRVIHEKRLRRILEVALSEDCDTIILGAFGCGAFQNDPEVVAKAYRNVIRDYIHAFKNIELAIYCSPRSDRNYQIFAREMRRC